MKYFFFFTFILCYVNCFAQKLWQISDLDRWRIKGRVSVMKQYLYDRDNITLQDNERTYVANIIYFNRKGFITRIEKEFVSDGVKAILMTITYRYDEAGKLKSGTIATDSTRDGTIAVDLYSFDDDRSYTVSHYTVEDRDLVLSYEKVINFTYDRYFKNAFVTVYKNGKKYGTDELEPGIPQTYDLVRDDYYLKGELLELYEDGNDMKRLYASDGDVSRVVRYTYEHYE